MAQLLLGTNNLSEKLYYSSETYNSARCNFCCLDKLAEKFGFG